MGWSGGTHIFDTVCYNILENSQGDDSFKLRVIRALIVELQDLDWDTECESGYYDHPIVKTAFCELGYGYFYDDEENV